MEKKRYNIGLDIGQTSVGWAVTDEKGHLIRHKGKNMWGVRLFDEGQTAATRRIYRSTRRRLARRKQRITQLQAIFAEDINQIDETFFIRLKESYLYKEDKSFLSSSILFDDKSYSDKQYYDRYPTIYHVRKDLMDSREKKDIRLVYLALHHMLKYRGHFLYGKADFGKVSANIQDDLEFLFSNLFEAEDYDITEINFDEIKVILSSASRAAYKREELERLIHSQNREINNKIKEIIKAFLGYKFSLIKLFGIEENEQETSTRLNISFQEEFEEEEIENMLGENIESFNLLKSIYNWATLEELLGDIESSDPKDKTISNAMIAKYHQHKKELKMLKKLVKEICPKDEYNNIFRIEGKESNYANYIKGGKNHTLENFNKYVKRVLDKYPGAKEHQYYNEIYDQLIEHKLLAKLNTTDNAVIPHQLHKVEMEKIIEGQGRYYPFLIRNKELLIKMLESKIPYYVGPLNTHSQFAWLEKKDHIQPHDHIYPWNFEEIVDVDRTAEEFIRRMTNKCTYLKEEDVLPRHSLLYSEFILLNELNKVRINGELIGKDIKRKMIEDVFKKKKTVKTIDIVKWVQANPSGVIDSPSDEVVVEGTQKEKEFASSLSSYYDFEKLFGKIDDSNIKMIEEIINWVTIFEDKDILERKIKQTYHLGKNKIDKILKFNYSGWARLSEQLINGIRSHQSDGRRLSIIEIMRDTNDNFMQIIHDQRFNFQGIIKERNPVTKREKLVYEDIKELQGSPAIKRGIWETVKIIEELVTIMGCKPTNIFMEFARSDEASKRTTSRINRMKSLYDAIKIDVDGYNYETTYKELQECIKNKERLDNTALYLYFTQNGKCMYTGEELNPERLSMYEVDHIIPRSYIKDDSMDNLVLVKSKANQLKKDSLLLDWEVRKKQKGYWDNLYKHGLISKKKYGNLNRDIIPDKELIGFINRQLVETRQISKHVADLLSEVYEDTKIVAIKARLVSDYREQYDLYKNRNVNDYHHAHDALITSIIGNFILRRYPKFEDEVNIKTYIKNFKANNLHKDHRNKYGFILTAMSKDYQGYDFNWKKDDEISKVKKALSYKDCFITRKVEEQTGQFYDETIYGKDDAKAKIPLKNGLDPKKYGGYSSLKHAYYVAIEYVRGRRTVRSIVGIPRHEVKRIATEGLEKYLIKSEKIANKDTLKILKGKIKKYQLIDFQGHKVYLVSDGEQRNAVQLLVDDQYKELLYKINENKISLEDKVSDAYNDLLISFFDDFIEKLIKHYPIYENIASNLKESKVDFISFEFDKKIKFIEQLLLTTAAKPTVGKFREFETVLKTNEAGRMQRTWNLDEMIFIDQSITGIFERRYRL